MISRYDRSARFFGEAGQKKLRSTSIAIVGAGGIGSHVVQQCAFLGVGSIFVIDHEELCETNRNRYVTCTNDDPVPGSAKVDLAERLIKQIDPSINVLKAQDSVVSDRGFELVQAADYVFGCVDSEGVRLILTEFCSAYRKPYVDSASEIEVGTHARYGGRICVSAEGTSCLMCLGQLDLEEAREELQGPEGRKMRQAIYGVEVSELGRSGPSVISINGVVASLAVTEFMVSVTGVRQARQLLTYRGDLGTVGVSKDPPQPGCHYCKSVFGSGDEADVQRYIRMGVGEFLR